MDREARTVFELVRRIALAAATPAALLALTATPASAATTAGPTTASDLMVDVIDRTNAERARAGCAPLEVEQELMVASVRQSHYMAATGDFGHIGWRGSTFESRSRAVGYHEVAAENIAWGYSSAAEAVEAWMASPSHRENILNCEARSFGAGVQRAANGTLYWTQVFGWR
ncbi:hypothetical protein Asp14428_52620 [Actinoplanes sp. NBRC 14428]|uniref:Uncharacterized protein YkwD n=1 Tax=Pseudosporangium ferrugineum TaxID=439699 RepID=A0A2T0S5R4_9ACTN|nr:CAP domain-containing protein [Pseudosporangium ferrugineum]PRY28752.1 uncharacterized protein YkwD [Pseudosporangium ferrugineum]BCJ53787.1 hypothetical protein Asp14428_52620 [Actinoplanes sp. NBRC 14428]